MNFCDRFQLRSFKIALLSLLILLIFSPATKAESPPDGVTFDLMYAINNGFPTDKVGEVKEGDEVLFYVNVGWDIKEPLY